MDGTKPARTCNAKPTSRDGQRNKTCKIATNGQSSTHPSTVTCNLSYQPPGPIRIQTRSPAAYSALEREVRVGRPAAVRTHKRERAYKSGN